MFPAASLAYRDAIALEGPSRLNRADEEADLQFRLAFSELRQGLQDAAETAARRAVALRQAQVPTQPTGLADALNALGVVLTNRRVQLDEARALLQQALGLRTAASGPDAYQTGQIMNNLAQVDLAARRFSSAESWIQRSLEVGRKQAMPVHVPVRLGVLALIMAGQERWAEARSTARQAVVMCEERYGPKNLYCRIIMGQEGHILLRAGAPAEALAALDAARAIEEAGGLPPNVATALLLSRRAQALQALGRWRDADEGHRNAVALARAQGDKLNLTRAEVAVNAAAFLVDRGRTEEARGLLREVQAAQQDRLAADHPQQQLALRLMARVGLPVSR
jgi:tetratricopeptide (TPR) repeat protein